MKKMTLLAMFAGALSLFAAEGVPGRVTADRLNLRFAPELRSPVAGRVEKDAQLQVLGVKGQWLEVAAPESLKVYVSEAYIASGKTIAAIKMHSDKASSSPSFGVLPAGSSVKLIDDRGYGWVRIAPPENIRLYTAKMYVEFDATQLAKPEAEKPAETAAPATPAVPAATVTVTTEAPAVPAAPATPVVAPAEKPAVEAAPAIPAPKEDVK